MINELIFILQAFTLGSFALLCLYVGKEALVAFISITCILANLFVIKQTTICGLNATCADAFTIGAVLGLNLLQEYFGKDVAKKAIWISFMLLIFYAIAAQLHLMYIPHSADTMHEYFAEILAAMPRIIIASFSVYLIVQHIDAWLYAYLKKLFHNNYLVMRNCISIGMCQLLDTVLFSFAGLYGIVDDIWSIIIVSYAIKIAALIMVTPAIALSRKIIRNSF